MARLLSFAILHIVYNILDFYCAVLMLQVLRGLTVRWVTYLPRENATSQVKVAPADYRICRMLLIIIG